jgi:hypothetical protein
VSVFVDECTGFCDSINVGEVTCEGISPHSFGIEFTVKRFSDYFSSVRQFTGEGHSFGNKCV